MTALKRALLLLALVAIVVLIGGVVRADGVPPLPLPDPIERHWGHTEPLKQHTQQRVEDINEELTRDDR